MKDNGIDPTGRSAVLKSNPLQPACGKKGKRLSHGSGHKTKAAPKGRLTDSEYQRRWRATHKPKSFVFLPHTVSAFDTFKALVGGTNDAVARLAFIWATERYAAQMAVGEELAVSTTSLACPFQDIAPRPGQETAPFPPAEATPTLQDSPSTKEILPVEANQSGAQPCSEQTRRDDIGKEEPHESMKDAPSASSLKISETDDKFPAGKGRTNRSNRGAKVRGQTELDLPSNL